MEIVLQKDCINEHTFYTDDELDLLHKLENGLVATTTHDQVMENLRNKLGLEQK